MEGIGGLMGNFTSDHEINIKDINRGQELCKDHEGLYMIKSKRVDSSVSCKDGTNLALKGAKE
jgi:hypothetical protein